MKKILVIEDEAETLDNLVLMLEMEGFQPLPAPNGRIGLSLAKKELPDVILCDVSMPEMDGYGVLEALRADEKTVLIPFIFLTAKGDKKDLRTGMNLGADDYLTKPASAEEVLGAINARLDRDSEKQQAAIAKVAAQTQLRFSQAFGIAWVDRARSRSAALGRPGQSQR